MKTSYSPAEREEIMARLFAGEAPSDLSRELNMPIGTLNEWRRHARTSEADARRTHQRQVFQVVMEAFIQTRLVVGQQRAMDYSKAQEGQGPIYSRSDYTHQLIDYTVDVEKAAKDVLKEADFAFFQAIANLDETMSVQSEQFMRMQERLGRVFIARKLYPVKGYFTVMKGKTCSTKS